MEPFSSALLLCGLVFPLTEQSQAPPEAPEVAYRLLFLAPGVSVDEAMRVLRLEGQEWYGGGGLDAWSKIYDIDPRHTLTLNFRFDDRREESILVKINFYHFPAPPPPARGADQVKVKINGKLLRADKTWIIEVKPSYGEEQTWTLEFASVELEKAARQLEGKKVVLSGELFRPFLLPAIGGESYLAPPPEPRVLVRALRAAKKEPR